MSEPKSVLDSLPQVPWDKAPVPEAPVVVAGVICACGKTVSLTKAGAIRLHKDKLGNVCPESGKVV